MAQCEAFGPRRIGTTRQQPVREYSLHVRDAVEAIFENPVIEKSLYPKLRGAVTAHGKQIMVEKRCMHLGACATAQPTRQGWYAVAGNAVQIGRKLDSRSRASAAMPRLRNHYQ